MGDVPSTRRCYRTDNSPVPAFLIVWHCCSAWAEWGNPPENNKPETIFLRLTQAEPDQPVAVADTG